ncbi:hypothetical protein NUKP38_27200 [Klebsiella variicola]|nr:hypothetical protein NUKP38_27200 [Klebsiella variicola]GKM56968.1 hypothetical protein NUKP67_25890 [Klebsiella variicola]
MRLYPLANIAARQNRFPEALTVLTGQTALLHEPLIAVVGQHLGPQIGVITCRIAAAEDMGEASFSMCAFTNKNHKVNFYLP